MIAADWSDAAAVGSEAVTVTVVVNVVGDDDDD